MLRCLVMMTKGDLKRLILFALCLSFKTGFAQIKPELFIGYNITNQLNIGSLPFKDYNSYSMAYGTNSPIHTFLAGAGVEIPLNKKWFLEPAILYFGNGTHLSEQTLNPGIDWYLNSTIRLYYLRIPVNLIYKINHGKSFQVFGGAGLYVARGLWGKENGELITEGGGTSSQIVDKNIKFSSGASYSGIVPNFNPYDFGYNMVAGVQWKQLKLTASISNGLTKAYSGYPNDMWNTAFSVSLTYQFPAIQ